MKFPIFEIFEDFLKEKEVEYVKNLKISAISPIRIGGIARIAVRPRTAEDLVSVIGFLHSHNMTFRVVGKMSNILPPDGMYDGVIVRCDRLTEYEISGSYLNAGCGFSIICGARALADMNLGGFEELAGIPGCLGGLIAMNAGAYGREISDIVQSVTVYDKSNDRMLTLMHDELEFAYRSSIVKRTGYVVLSAVMSLSYCGREAVISNLERYKRARKDKQPLEYPSLGSAFKRPEGGYAAEMIEKCGLKGYSVGGAQISEKHAGFVINRANATAEDVYRLIEIVRQGVFNKFGVWLEPEIENL